MKNLIIIIGLVLFNLTSYSQMARKIDYRIQSHPEIYVPSLIMAAPITLNYIRPEFNTPANKDVFFVSCVVTSIATNYLLNKLMKRYKHKSKFYFK